MKRIMLAIVFLLACTIAGSAQVFLSGQVRNTGGFNVPNATVAFHTCVFNVDNPGCGGQTILYATSNSFGYFSFGTPVWDNDVYVVVTSARLYQTDTEGVTVFGDTFDHVTLTHN
jgi:hypothetical protein